MALRDPEARRAYQKDWYARNAERTRALARAGYAANPRKYSVRSLTYRQRRPEKTIWRRVRDRARVEGLAFDLEVSDITIPAVCPVLGIPIRMHVGKQRDDSISVDRLNPAKGYTRGNIAVMSFLANRIKSNATANQVAAVARWMRQWHFQ